MHRSPISIVAVALLAAGLSASAQVPAPASAPRLPSASSQLRSSLYSVQSTLSNLRLRRWKRGRIRDEAAGDIQAIQNEIRVNLPPLISASDAEPNSLSKALPVVKHVGAVYDVLLRVYDASRVAAPGEQVGELQVILSGLEHARLSMNDRLQTIATQQEQQMSALRVKLERQVEFKCPAPPPVKPCPKPTRRHHYVRRHRVIRHTETKKTESSSKPK
jgi:hypothetical protein